MKKTKHIVKVSCEEDGLFDIRYSDELFEFVKSRLIGIGEGVYESSEEINWEATKKDNSSYGCRVIFNGGGYYKWNESDMLFWVDNEELYKYLGGGYQLTFREFADMFYLMNPQYLNTALPTWNQYINK